VSSVQRAAVVGAGTMGAGIAAQFANAGIPVVLLDTAAPGPQRDARARAGVERQLAAGGFMRADRSRLVTTGCVEDDLGLLRDADWIVEAVIENAAIKRDLYGRIDAVRKAGAAVSSNTSTIRLATLAEGLPPGLAADLAITHFFNPPRAMRLLELVTGPATAPATAALLRDAGERLLGKTLVDCRDTPGFIANRLGCFWLAVGVQEAQALGLTVEAADAVAGAPFGVPRTGVFGLLDLIGLDLVAPVWGSLLEALPPGDALQGYRLPENPLLRALVAEGRLGRKAGGGFYRQDKARRREAVDLATGAYRAEQLATLPVRELRALCAGEDALACYAWRLLSRVVAYAATVAPEVAEDVAAIDTAMALGYGWAEGPFALADRVGTAWIAERLRAEGAPVPALLAAAAARGGFHALGPDAVLGTDGAPRAVLPRPGLVTLSAENLLPGEAASLHDLGEGVAGFALRTKMGTWTDAVFDALAETLTRVQRDFRALVLTNDNPRGFSAGADLGQFRARIRAGDFAGIEAFVARGQAAFRALLAAPFPVVGAAQGLALGGGCEALLHCDAVVAHAELTAGLPEFNVGILPGWGGCTRLLQRRAAQRGVPQGPLAPAMAVLATLMAGRFSTSALDAQEMGLLRDSDAVVMHRDHLLAAARGWAIALAEAGYQPPPPVLMARSGASGRLALMNEVEGNRVAGRLGPHDAAIAEKLVTILTGDGCDPLRPVPEEMLYAAEREAVVALCRTPQTLARIEHMLETGKPLRN